MTGWFVYIKLNCVFQRSALIHSMIRMLFVIERTFVYPMN